MLVLVLELVVLNGTFVDEGIAVIMLLLNIFIVVVPAPTVYEMLVPPLVIITYLYIVPIV